MRYVEQTRFPGPPPWNPLGVPDTSGYEPPDRSSPALDTTPASGPLVAVIGTVRDEAVPWERSWRVWERQALPDWLRGRVEYHVLDDGSSDGIRDAVAAERRVGSPLVYSRWREPGEGPDRSCTLLFNAAIRGLVTAPLVVIQWWDRIPGSLQLLAHLVRPHADYPGIVTTGVSRHIGGSSSVDGMDPDALEVLLGTVPWRDDPSALNRIAGRIGGHCVPGAMTESSCLAIPRAEFLALGGYDERYTARHGYPNVTLWRRVLHSGLVALTVPEPHGSNYHQSHPQDRSAKDLSLLGDLRVRVNEEDDWGCLEPAEVVW